MLEKHNRARAELLIGQLNCTVELPDSWRDDYFDRKGIMPSDLNDRRRFVRHVLRAKAVMRIAQCLPAFERSPEYYGVYTYDISRVGISFLHIAELFPGERCQLWLPTQTSRVVVTRCRYYNPRCYLIGTRFDTDEAAGE